MSSLAYDIAMRKINQMTEIHENACFSWKETKKTIRFAYYTNKMLPLTQKP